MVTNKEAQTDRLCCVLCTETQLWAAERGQEAGTSGILGESLEQSLGQVCGEGEQFREGGVARSHGNDEFSVSQEEPVEG